MDEANGSSPAPQQVGPGDAERRPSPDYEVRRRPTASLLACEAARQITKRPVWPAKCVSLPGGRSDEAGTRPPIPRRRCDAAHPRRGRRARRVPSSSAAASPASISRGGPRLPYTALRTDRPGCGEGPLAVRKSECPTRHLDGESVMAARWTEEGRPNDAVEPEHPLRRAAEPRSRRGVVLSRSEPEYP